MVGSLVLPRPSRFLADPQGVLVAGLSIAAGFTAVFASPIVSFKGGI